MADATPAGRTARCWAVVNLLGGLLWLGLGGVLVWQGYPWGAPAYAVIPDAVCLALGGAGLATCAAGGWWADRQRERGGSPAVGLRVGAAGALAAGFAALAAGAPWWVELWHEPDALPLLGSASADVGLTALYAGVPLLSAAGTALAARRTG